MNNVEQGIASVGRKGHHHVHIAVFGIEVIAQHGPEKLERLDAPLATEILNLILWNWNARRDLSDHGQHHITASPQDRSNFRLAFRFGDWLKETERAERLESAIARVIAEGKVRTYDMGGNACTLDVAKAIADCASGQR